MYSLNITSCIVSTKRFILKGARLPSLCSFAALPSTPLAMEGEGYACFEEQVDKRLG
jgi:hypothetical protein